MCFKNFCLANFNPILGHLNIVVFQHDVFGPSKILFYATKPNFRVHEKYDHCLKAIQQRNKEVKTIICKFSRFFEILMYLR